MTNYWKERILARLCSGAMAAFRKTPVRFTPDDLRNLRLSFSQFGEDLVIADHLLNRREPTKGIYIDAGCFDPFKYSNTRLINLLGWNGINIDAADDVIKRFARHRPDDYNVCAALSSANKEMLFVGEQGLASRRLQSTNTERSTESTVSVRTTSLDRILELSPFANTNVDLLDIDCEGHDLEVLKGFPFTRISPFLICVESHSQEERDGIISFLTPKNYSLFCERGPTLFWKLSQGN